jgi:uncharacterized protein (TIGR01319 family)
MKPVLLIDFGSTYTKLTAVDLDTESVIGTSQSYTTVETDINDGLNKGLSLLEEQTGAIDFQETYACSSAAGGLKMITSGLVPELTSEAAKLASLGAGAKVTKVYSFSLTEDDLDEIVSYSPDIFLLAGGTDGGNTENILHNAKMLASIEPAFPIIVAGNRVASRECEKILTARGHEVFVCPNIMPKFGLLNIDEAQKKIREVFLRRIVQAKGLSQASSLLSDIMMPTPSAVLAAMKLLADGTDKIKGIGELVGVDVGGATTDIYSMSSGKPKHQNTVLKGLPEPYAKRTVEGDIGMRYSIRGIADAAGIDRVSELSGLAKKRADELIDYLAEHTDVLPDGDPELEALDYALASLATEIAVSRHAGKIEEAYTMMGLTYVQEGKDLTEVKQIIVTGGSLIRAKRTVDIARHALYSPDQPMSLRPKEADIRIDKQYILAAMGLLSVYYPDAALSIMKKELDVYGSPK